MEPEWEAPSSITLKPRGDTLMSWMVYLSYAIQKNTNIPLKLYISFTLGQCVLLKGIFPANLSFS